MSPLFIPVLASLCAAQVVLAYDEHITEQMGQAARAAYCGQDLCLKQLKAFTCDACKASGLKVGGLETFKTEQHVVTPGSTEGQFWYVAKVMDKAYKDTCLVSFRGSSNSANWATDFDKVMMPLEEPAAGEQDVNLHKGFYGTYLNLEKILVEYLVKEQCASLLITGHSLGAAQATLASYFLTNGPHLKKKFGLNQAFAIKFSYQFESPRVGNTAFSELYNKNVADRFQAFRVTYGSDPVNLFPAPDDDSSHGIYRHVSSEVYYPSSSSFRKAKFTLCSGPEDPKCSVQYQNKALVGLIAVGNDAEHCVVSWLSTKNVCQCNTCGPADK